MKIKIQNVEWCTSATRVIHEENININFKYLLCSLFNLNKTKLERLMLFFYKFLTINLNIKNLDWEYFNKKLVISKNELVFLDDKSITKLTENIEYNSYILIIKG